MGATSVTAVPSVGGLSTPPAHLRHADGMAANSPSVGDRRAPTSDSFAQQLSRHSQTRVDDPALASRHVKPAGALAQPHGAASARGDTDVPPGETALSADLRSEEIGEITATVGDGSAVNIGAEAPTPEAAQPASPDTLALAQWIAGVLPAAAQGGANCAAAQVAGPDATQPTSTTQSTQPAQLAQPAQPAQTAALASAADPHTTLARSGVAAGKPAPRGAAPTLDSNVPLATPESSTAALGESATEAQASTTKPSPEDQALRAVLPAADAPPAASAAMQLAELGAAPLVDPAGSSPDQTPALRGETDSARPAGSARIMAMADHGPTRVERDARALTAGKMTPADLSQPPTAAIEHGSTGTSDGPGVQAPAFSHLLDAAAQSLAVAPPTAAGNQASSAAAAVDVSLATPVMSPEFREALGVQVSVLARDGVHHAELHLNPSDMGPISVRIALDGTQAQVDFGVDTAATRALIESGLPELASALREAGLTLTGGGVSQHARGQAGDGGGERQRDGNPGPTGRPGHPPGSASEDDAGTGLPRPRSVRVAGGVDLYA